MSKKINNNEVTFVYPGIEVIRTNENYNLRKPFNMKMREQDQEVNIITEGISNFVIIFCYLILLIII